MPYQTEASLLHGRLSSRHVCGIHRRMNAIPAALARINRPARRWPFPEHRIIEGHGWRWLNQTLAKADAWKAVSLKTPSWKVPLGIVQPVETAVFLRRNFPREAAFPDRTAGTVVITTLDGMGLGVCSFFLKCWAGTYRTGSPWPQVSADLLSKLRLQDYFSDIKSNFQSRSNAISLFPNGSLSDIWTNLRVEPVSIHALISRSISQS